MLNMYMYDEYPLEDNQDNREWHFNLWNQKKPHLKRNQIIYNQAEYDPDFFNEEE